MKKALVLSLVATMAALSLTACGDKSVANKVNVSVEQQVATTEARNYQVEESTTEESYDVFEMDNFEVLLTIIREDENVGSSEYQLYLERVAVKDESTTEKEEIILASHIEITNSDGTTKVIEKAIAAPYAYIDPYREDGKIEQDAKVEWKFENADGKGAYEAESVIRAAMQYAGVTESDLASYQKVIVATNETNIAD